MLLQNIYLYKGLVVQEMVRLDSIMYLTFD